MVAIVGETLEGTSSVNGDAQAIYGSSEEEWLETDSSRGPGRIREVLELGQRAHRSIRNEPASMNGRHAALALGNGQRSEIQRAVRFASRRDHGHNRAQAGRSCFTRK